MISKGTEASEELHDYKLQLAEEACPEKPLRNSKWKEKN
jgi:hypothetical protein